SIVFTRPPGTFVALNVRVPSIFSDPVTSPKVADLPLNVAPAAVTGIVNVSGFGAGAPNTLPVRVTVSASVSAVRSNFTAIVAVPVEPNVVFVQGPVNVASSKAGSGAVVAGFGVDGAGVGAGVAVAAAVGAVVAAAVDGVVAAGVDEHATTRIAASD